MKFKKILLTLSASALIAASAHAENGKETGKKGGRPTPAEMFQKIDSDGNGTISVAEAAAAERTKRMAENFSTIDTNGDGELTPEELKAHMETRRAQQGEGKGPQKGERQRRHENVRYRR